MKNFLRILGITCGAAILSYAAYLFYDKFLKEKDEDDLYEDLEDVDFEFDDEEKQPCISAFAQKVKAAAEKQLDKVR